MKNGKIKIGDFGIAKALTNTKNNATTIIGTPYYFSPEIINGEPYNYKTDIWSLGVVLYEMCCLKLPFESNNIAQLSIKIMKGKYDSIPSRYSKNMANLIKNMLNIDQKLRPNINEVMQSPLLKNYHNNKYANKSSKNLNSNKKPIINILSLNII
jgi:serine/threonine protein kinase